MSSESIVKAKGQSIIQCLDPEIDTEEGRIPDLRRRIIKKALFLLLDIHENLSRSVENSDSAKPLQNPSQQKTVDGLLDLVSLEGIYPFLSSGVGVPIERRVRSVLQGGLVSKPSPGGGATYEDKSLLAEICDGLYNITQGEGRGLTSSLQARTLVDLIAGLGDLAYAPSLQENDSKKKRDRIIRSLIDRCVAFRSYKKPTMTCNQSFSLLFAEDTNIVQNPNGCSISSANFAAPTCNA